MRILGKVFRNGVSHSNSCTLEGVRTLADSLMSDGHFLITHVLFFSDVFDPGDVTSEAPYAGATYEAMVDKALYAVSTAEGGGLTLTFSSSSESRSGGVISCEVTLDASAHREDVLSPIRSIGLVLNGDSSLSSNINKDLDWVTEAPYIGQTLLCYHTLNLPAIKEEGNVLNYKWEVSFVV